MQVQIKVQTNGKLALRDPEGTELGRNIVRRGLLLMHEIGFEQFTFKKLAEALGTTEAGIYRYFTNKHRLLLYILTWYWNFMEYLVVFSLQNLHDVDLRIRKVIEILTNDLPDDLDHSGMDKMSLLQLVMAESSKAYLVKDVQAINNEQLFKPYKDLCGRIAALFAERNPTYPYPRSLASTLLEMAHFQPYFKQNLPSLTDFSREGAVGSPGAFLEHLVFAALDSKTAQPAA